MLLRSIKGLLTLVRIVPVIAWSFCAILIAVGFAVHDVSRFSAVHWAIVFLLSLGALLLQGIAAHSFNDQEDWTSGLGYVPFLGELLAVPAMAVGVIGAYYELTHSIALPVIWVSLIHALLCIAWLMQHHLSHIEAELAANPKKLTTVAYVSMKYGRRYARLPGVFYCMIAFFISFVACLIVHPLFIISLSCSLLGALAAWKTNPYNIGNITYNQLKMIMLTVTHTLFLFTFEVLT